MSTHLPTGQYLGSTIARTECRGAVLTEVRHPVPHALPAHSHESAYFCLLLGGHYVEEIGRTRLDYARFSVGFHPAGLFHRDRIGEDGARFFLIAVPGSWAARWAGQFDASLHARPRLLSHDAAVAAARLWGWQRRNLLTSNLADETLCELLGEAADLTTPREAHRPAWIGRCLEMVHSSIDEPIAIVDLAAALDLHPVYLAREFRRRFGRTIGEYARRLRINAGCELLLDSHRSLADIALATGFADQSHFTRVFTAAIGCGPGTYRSLLLQS
jgi:AraC family transcriptional regulator